ncbi:sel1 repeat family protein [Phragmitibacter flavus]|uniref:Sel1 repeat family protein n=1 Tax=Phragmitibacter flavus TaxID=2576071 RepID=A0A5R8KIA8_9BACT|nr:tetratricopeptide repeat protein [Phragmitibacter flavus]TLD71715.1 sel1 repeat family protein [Phragmitibacter flavus]
MKIIIVSFSLLLFLCRIAVAEVAGLAVVHTGSNADSFAKVYEFIQLERFKLSAQGSFKLTLTNGQPMAGLAAHLRQVIEYPSPHNDLTDAAVATAFLQSKIEEMEKAHKKFEYSRPYLVPRIKQAREMLTQAKAGRVLINGNWMEQSAYAALVAKRRSEEIPEMTIDEQALKQVKLRGVTDRTLIVEHSNGMSRLSMEKLSYGQLKEFFRISELAKTSAELKSLHEQFHPEIILNGTKRLGVRVVEIKEDEIIITSEDGPVVLSIKNTERKTLEILSSRSATLNEHLQGPAKHYQNGLLAEQAKNWGAAYAAYQLAADGEHLEGMVNYATLIAEGKGGDLDASKAQDLFQRASKQGDAIAAFNLGLLLFRSTTKGQSNVSLVTALEQAAANGIHQASLLLGVVHLSGRGAPVDFAKARKFVDEAIRHSVSGAQDVLRELENKTAPLEEPPVDHASIGTQSIKALIERTSGADAHNRATDYSSFRARFPVQDR